MILMLLGIFNVSWIPQLEWWKYVADETNVADMEAGVKENMLLKWKRDWWKEYCRNGSGIDKTNVDEMEDGVMKICCWNGSGINDKNIAEMEAGLVKVCCWIGSGKFYKINILFCDELSATNFPRRIVRDELSATNCPATNCPGTVYIYILYFIYILICYIVYTYTYLII